MIGASRLVFVGLSVPVPPETDHLDAHVSSTSNSRSVEAGRLAPNCDTSPHQIFLLLNRQIGAEMNSAWIDFHDDCSKQGRVSSRQTHWVTRTAYCWNIRASAKSPLVETPGQHNLVRAMRPLLLRRLLL